MKDLSHEPAGGAADQPAPVAKPAVLAKYDANGHAAAKASVGAHLDLNTDATSAAAAPRPVAEPRRPPSRRLARPIVLFLLTCVTTFIAGCYHWAPYFIWTPGWDDGLREVQRNWSDGLIYMGCVMFALLCHEMGHFLMTLRHKVHASYPYFIPVPITLTGTMGAVIGMEHSRADRKQLFDIGIAGPLAGLVPTMLFVVIGVLVADHSTGGLMEFGDPLIVQLLAEWLRPDLPDGSQLVINPFLMAGRVGLLVTGLNMMPVSQLDGGHVAYAVLGRRWGLTLGRAFTFATAGYFVISNNYAWILMWVLVVLMGIDHPRTSDDNVPLGWFRRTLGLASLAIPVFCFTPTPLIL